MTSSRDRPTVTALSRSRKIALIALALLVPMVGQQPRADGKSKHRDQLQDVPLDQNEALDRLKRNEFKPLSDVIAAATGAVPGEVIRVKVKRLKDRITYELKIITPQGSVREIYVDPATLEVLKIE